MHGFHLHHCKWSLAARQLFLDDNIHNDKDDSIVAVRIRAGAGEPFVPLSGELTRRIHGAVLRKVPTLLPILDPDWFLGQIEASGVALDAMRGAPLARARRVRTPGGKDGTRWREKAQIKIR